MDETIRMVSNTNASEMDGVLRAVMGRYRELFPGWELAIMAYPAEKSEEKTRCIHEMIALLEEEERRNR